MKDNYKEVFEDIERVLIVLAHPDDIEICCGGLVARLIDDGKAVRSVIMTDGSKGMHDQDLDKDEFKKIRFESQIKGGEELGLEKDQNKNLGIPDGEVESDLDTIGKLVYEIRTFKPQLVITHKPYEIINHFSKDVRWVNHRDHRNTASATFDAIYPYAIDHGFFPEQLVDGIKGWEVNKILTSDSYIDKNTVAFDISDQIEKKRNAITCHTAGNVLAEEGVNDFIDECEFDGRYFERLGFVEV